MEPLAADSVIHWHHLLLEQSSNDWFIVFYLPLRPSWFSFLLFCTSDFSPPVHHMFSPCIYILCVCIYVSANSSSGSLSLRVLNHKQGNGFFAPLPLVPVEWKQWVALIVWNKMYLYTLIYNLQYNSFKQVTPDAWCVFISKFPVAHLTRMSVLWVIYRKCLSFDWWD